MKKLSTILYWTTTGLLSAFLLFVAFNHISMSPDMLKGTAALGFPARMMPFLGAMKILGVLAILASYRHDLTVGAYAGVFFYGLGAAALHLTAGETIGQAFPALLVSVLALASYALWRRTRGRKELPAWKAAKPARSKRQPTFQPERSTIVSLL